MYKQLKAFNKLQAGTVKGMCLRNVRLGYGIGAKYDTATDAWNHTQQMTGEIPTGVDVPLYYSYTTTINGVRKDYGHINVRLANGQVWNDGKIYANTTSYRLLHPSVRYRGWSNAVNGVAVIQYAPAPPVTPNKMPPVGSRVKFSDSRTAFVAGTTKVKGTLPPDIRIVRGYDPKYPNRILVNSASVGNGVAVALYFTNGVRIPGWQAI